MIRLFQNLLLLLLFLPGTLYATEGEKLLAECQAPKLRVPQVCELGGPFLCVNTPPGGVKENFVILKGRLNLENSALGQLWVATQQEYTKQFQRISLATPLSENCWNQSLTPHQNFCLEKDGAFSVFVPLSELGPHTIFLTANRLQGSSMQVTTRTSRVVPVTLTSDVVRYEPNILSGSAPAGTKHVRVTLDLLAGCGENKEACDFIGATTGGVLVGVENQVSSTNHKMIRCETNSIQGGAGRFVIGVPVQAGKNQLTLSVCNAATGFQKASCPTMVSPLFEVGGISSQVVILSPLEGGPSLWDASSYVTIPFRFKIFGMDAKICDDSVHVAFNLGASQKVCANSEGVYEILLTPEEGFNVALIEANIAGQKILETVSFGFGKPLSPFGENGKVKPGPEWKLDKAIQFWVSKGFLNQTLLPKLEAFLNSPNFSSWLSSITEKMGRGSQQSPNHESRTTNHEVLNSLSYCPKGKGLGNLRIKVMRPPQIGKATLGPSVLHDNHLEFSIQAENVSAAIQLYKDENGDGLPDIDPLPLKIGFKTLNLKPVVEARRLSSPFSDCDYKRRGACFELPALFVPSQFQGNASSAGAFAVCDTSQKISPKMDRICHSLNVVDRQTGGVLQEKILDALNNAYACQGTQYMMQIFQEGIPFQKILGDFEFQGRVGVNDLEIREAGVLVSFHTRFGSDGVLSQWPEALRLKNPGILIASRPAKPLIVSKDPRGLSFAISFPMLSQLFWGLESLTQGEPSIVVDDAFFKKQGIDFEVACKPKEEGDSQPHPLCPVRPRASEIFGPVITDFGYLEPHTPLRLALTPSRVFPLHINVLDPSGLIQIELADWELAIQSEDSPLVRAKLSLRLSAQISFLAPTPENPDHFVVIVRLNSAQSKLWLVEKKGTNTTMIPGPVLLANLEEKLKLAIDSFSKEGNEIKIKIPRFIFFAPDSLWAQFGLKELTWGPEGLDLGWDEDAERILGQGVPLLE